MSMVDHGENRRPWWRRMSEERVYSGPLAYVDRIGKGNRERHGGRWKSWYAKRSAMLRQGWQGLADGQVEVEEEGLTDSRLPWPAQEQW